MSVALLLSHVEGLVLFTREMECHPGTWIVLPSQAECQPAPHNVFPNHKVGRIYTRSDLLGASLAVPTST